MGLGKLRILPADLRNCDCECEPQRLAADALHRKLRLLSADRRGGSASGGSNCIYAMFDTLPYPLLSLRATCIGAASLDKGGPWKGALLRRSNLDFIRCEIPDCLVENGARTDLRTNSIGANRLRVKLKCFNIDRSPQQHIARMLHFRFL